MTVNSFVGICILGFELEDSTFNGAINTAGTSFRRPSPTPDPGRRRPAPGATREHRWYFGGRSHVAVVEHQDSLTFLWSWAGRGAKPLRSADG
jgi:hypothetical protein